MMNRMIISLSFVMLATVARASDPLPVGGGSVPIADPQSQVCNMLPALEGEVVINKIDRVTHSLQGQVNVVEIEGQGGTVLGFQRNKTVKIRVRFRRIGNCVNESCTAMAQARKSIGQFCGDLANTAFGQGKRFVMKNFQNGGFDSALLVTSTGTTAPTVIIVGAAVVPADPVVCTIEPKAGVDGTGELLSPSECGLW